MAVSNFVVSHKKAGKERMEKKKNKFETAKL
jgi:hypothetical protein